MLYNGKDFSGLSVWAGQLVTHFTCIMLYNREMKYISQLFFLLQPASASPASLAAASQGAHASPHTFTWAGARPWTHVGDKKPVVLH